MADKPILFSAPMIRALLNTKPGVWPAEPIDPTKPWKWQTRRIVAASNSTVNGRTANAKHDAREWFDGWVNLGINDSRVYTDGHHSENQPYGMFGTGRNEGYSCGEYLHAPVVNDEDERWYRVRSRVHPGDTLWVREMLRDGQSDFTGWTYAADGNLVMVDAADETAMLVWAHHKQQDYCPSIHMPRWASRISLKVMRVRCERVKQISDHDIYAEGVSVEDRSLRGILRDPREGWDALWESINGEDSLKQNPWVFVYDFRRLK